MTIGVEFPNNRPFLLFYLFALTITLLHCFCAHSASSAVCDFSFTAEDKLYSYTLTSPIRNHPHGILSEDGFYKVAVNETVIWFQLCDVMIFNHDPPTCVDCSECGGSSRCGLGCSALAADKIGGYPVCNAIGRPSGMSINVIDKKSPHMGVIIKMSNISPRLNCSLSVSVVCDSDRVQGPSTFDKVGRCDYVTLLKHPSGCAKTVSVQGKGLGWFGTLMTIVLCLFGGYLLTGAVYRYFFLGIRGMDIVPNLEFWATIPHRTQSLFMSLVRRFRGPSHGYRSSYPSVNF